MRQLKAALVAATMLAIIPATKADLVLVDNGTGFGGCTDANCRSFTDMHGTGFGNLPRILTVQTNTYEAGLTAPDGNGGVIYPAFPHPGAPGLSGTNVAIQNGQFKGSAPSLFSLGWNDASKVGVAFVSDQTGQSGITLQSLSLSLYTTNGGGQAPVTLLHTFSLAGPVNYTADELRLQPGNGNAAFSFDLDSAQQTLWNSLVDGNSLSTLYIGLAASLGCSGTVSSTCQVSNGGPESFAAIAAPRSPAVVPLPAAMWLFGTGLVGLIALGRKKKVSTGSCAQKFENKISSDLCS